MSPGNLGLRSVLKAVSVSRGVDLAHGRVADHAGLRRRPGQHGRVLAVPLRERRGPADGEDGGELAGNSAFAAPGAGRVDRKDKSFDRYALAAGRVNRNTTMSK